MARVKDMRSLKIANGIYREMVKVKEKNLLSVEELHGFVEMVLSDIKAEYEPKPASGDAAAS